MLCRLLCAAALFATPALATCDDGERVIRVSHTAPATGNPRAQTLAALADWLNADLQGRACVTVAAEGTLFADDEVLDALRAGEVDLAAVSLTRLSSEVEGLLLLDLPFLFDTPEEVLGSPTPCWRSSSRWASRPSASSPTA